MKPTLCFGEIMVRFSPRNRLRFAQVMPGQMNVAFAGAEANVAVTIAQLGGRAEFVSVLPDDPIGDAALASLRAARVGADFVQRPPGGRCGLYFVETGANQRGGLVIYDRAHSSFSLAGADQYNWPNILQGAGWLHTTGIAAGVSKTAAEATLAAVQIARRAGLPVSCDLNFRRKLWHWQPGLPPESLARQTMEGILLETDLLIGNVYDLAMVIGDDAEATDQLDGCAALAMRVARKFPQLRLIAITRRETLSADSNRWGALLFRPDDQATFMAPFRHGAYAPYQIDSIIDRVGTGDAFAGALVFALQTSDLAEPSRALAFATAAGCMAHSIEGDFFMASRAEVDAMMNGDTAGHLSR
jgi:2-dehydro-3-deoxygluconokinase